MSKLGRVLVAMSGGIDSTVAAILLHEQGYEVIGVTMKTWDYAAAKLDGKETGCCSLDSINDARQIAVERGFSHTLIDIRPEFGGFVINNFIDEYLAGRTPNPCVLCNTHIKWEALLKRANMLDCEFIATGHYAQVRHENNRYVLSKGLDANKDQSYVLWGLSQESLKRSIFPIGAYHKPHIRALAKEMGYTELANKAESYEICFVPDNDYRGFLKRQVDGLEDRVKGGNFIDINGKPLGKHKGYPFYTIGQRKGLDIAFGKPMFVTAIDPIQNTVTLGELSDLERNAMLVKQINMVKYEKLNTNGLPAITKIRYKDTGTDSLLLPTNETNSIQVNFTEYVKAIAPGQAAVFYEGNDVIGGGWIQSALTVNNQ